jgi:hypothetical protein
MTARPFLNFEELEETHMIFCLRLGRPKARTVDSSPSNACRKLPMAVYNHSGSCPKLSN